MLAVTLLGLRAPTREVAIFVLGLVAIALTAWVLAGRNSGFAEAPAALQLPADTNRPAPASRRFLFLAAVSAAVGFAVAWWLVTWLTARGAYGSVPLGDLGLYRQYGRAALSGSVPYRDFAVVYPPLSLVPFIITSFITHESANRFAYRDAFEAVMLLAGLLMTVMVVNVAWSVSGQRRDVLIAASFVAVSPLLLGPTMQIRYDLWPAMLLAASMAAVLIGRNRIGFAILGLGILAKIYPAVAIPVLAIYVWRRHGRAEAVRGVLITAGVVALGVAPFLLLAADGTISAFARLVERPLEIETIGAALLVVAHNLTGLGIDTESSFGSVNLIGPLPAAIAIVQSTILVAGLLAAWISFGRGPAEARRLVVVVAASLCLFIAFGKVLSPQYVVWLIPAVAVLPGMGGRTAIVVLAGILLLTSVEWPGAYPDYVHFATGPTMLVVTRDLALCLLAAFLVAQTRRARRPGSIVDPVGSPLAAPVD
jgi:hypothetical protein